VKLITVGQFPSETEATLAKDLLQEQGIRAHLGGSVPQIASQLPVGCILQVREEDAKRTADVLNDMGPMHTSGLNKSTKWVNRWMLLMILVLLAACVAVWIAAILGR
jgi:hypothetical protein